MPRLMPPGTEIITSFTDLRWYDKKFAEGHLGLLMEMGPPGLAKSEVMKRTAGDRIFWIGGQTTPFEVYCMLFRERQRRFLHIVLDDAQSLWEHRGGQGGSGISLLKQLCETDPEKTLSWHSQAADRAGVDQSFQIHCNVAIVANDWLPRNIHSDALEDRAHKNFFDPPAAEVHRYVGEWFDDREIYNFVGEHLQLIIRPSIRAYYVLAQERKRAGTCPGGEDWRDFILKQCDLHGAALQVAKLLADPNYTSMQDRERVFIQGGWGCRSTFFEHARQLRARTPSQPLLKMSRLSD